MKITMRLYRIHDLDLLYLYKVPNFSIQKAIKSALTAYVTNQDIEIEYPTDTNIALPRSVMIHIYLSEKKDAEIIAWLKNISKGYRNSLLKNILRYYLQKPSVDPYLMNNNIQMYGSLLQKAETKTENSSELIDDNFEKNQDNKINNNNSNEIFEKNEEKIKEENVDKQNETTNITESDSFDLYSAFNDMLSSF